MTAATPAPAPAAPIPRWAGARRLLAVRLDNLGDVLMTTPALRALRESLPGATLTLLGSPSGAAVARHIPLIDDVVAFDAPWVRPAHAPATGTELGRAEARLVEALARRCFDAAVIFTVCTQSALPAALLCRLAGIPLRLAHSRENPYELLSDWVRDTEAVADGMRHEVERQLALVAAVGCTTGDTRLVLHHGAREAAAARARIAAAGADPARPYVVVHVGATAESRRYEAPSFGIAAQRIAERSGSLVVFTGSAAESVLIERARRDMKADSVSLAGQLDIGELAALIARAAVLVANNTGPLHIAAATGTPVVALYALTNPQHTPWQARAAVLNHDVPCRNCLRSVCPQRHHDCLAKVAPGDVADAALALMQTRSGGSEVRACPDEAA